MHFTTALRILMSLGDPLWVSTKKSSSSSYLAASLRALYVADIPIHVDKSVDYEDVIEALARRVAAKGGQIPDLQHHSRAARKDQADVSRYNLSQALAVSMVERVWLLRQRRDRELHSAETSASSESS